MPPALGRLTPETAIRLCRRRAAAGVALCPPDSRSYGGRMIETEVARKYGVTGLDSSFPDHAIGVNGQVP